jgi:hypothetical protein
MLSSVHASRRQDRQVVLASVSQSTQNPIEAIAAGWENIGRKPRFLRQV